MRRALTLCASVLLVFGLACSKTENTTTQTTETTTTTMSNTAPASDTTGTMMTDTAATATSGTMSTAPTTATSGTTTTTSGTTSSTSTSASANPKPEEMPGPMTSASGSDAALVSTGQTVFKSNCVACHGTDASGNTAIGKKNNIPDFRSKTVQDKTDAQLTEIINNGIGPISKSAHKSKHLTADQVKAVIAFIRSLK